MLVAILTVFPAAEPTCHSYGQVKMLSGAQWQEFKLLYRPNTLIHLIACVFENDIQVEKRYSETDHETTHRYNQSATKAPLFISHNSKQFFLPVLLPVSPAPAAPNREAMIAMPVAEPRTAAPPAPSTALAPAATKGAASPPVTPGNDRKQKLLSDKICKVK